MYFNRIQHYEFLFSVSDVITFIFTKGLNYLTTELLTLIGSKTNSPCLWPAPLMGFAETLED